MRREDKHGDPRWSNVFHASWRRQQRPWYCPERQRLGRRLAGYKLRPSRLVALPGRSLHRFSLDLPSPHSLPLPLLFNRLPSLICRSTSFGLAALRLQSPKFLPQHPIHLLLVLRLLCPSSTSGIGDLLVDQVVHDVTIEPSLDAQDLEHRPLPPVLLLLPVYPPYSVLVLPRHLRDLLLHDPGVRLRNLPPRLALPPTPMVVLRRVRRARPPRQRTLDRPGSPEGRRARVRRFNAFCVVPWLAAARVMMMFWEYSDVFHRRRKEIQRSIERRKKENESCVQVRWAQKTSHLPNARGGYVLEACWYCVAGVEAELMATTLPTRARNGPPAARS